MAKVDQIRAKAAEFFQKGDYVKAVAEYKKVLELEPGNASVYNYIGDAHVKLTAIDEAVANYLEAVKGYSNDALYNNAVAVCKKILRIRKDDPDVYKTLGELFIHQGLVNEAITNLLEYAERMMKDGKSEMAYPVYHQIVELNPQNLPIRAKLAEMYLSQKRIPEATNEFALLAQAYREHGRQIEAEALEARVRSMRGEPSAPAPSPAIEIKPAKVIEEIMLQRQEAPTAVPEIQIPTPTPAAPEIVIEREPVRAEPEELAMQDWATNIELGDLLVEIGSTQEAVDQYHTAAGGYLNDGNIERAVEVFKKIVALQPLELRSRQKLVMIAQESNQPEQMVEALLELAECLRRRELKEQAAAVYQKVLEIDAINETALENLSLLLPELPEGAMEMPGIEVQGEAPAFPEPEISLEQPPAQPEAEPASAPTPDLSFEPAQAQAPSGWEPPPAEEPQSFMVGVQPEPEPETAEAPAGDQAGDQGKVHWGRDIVEGGRQSRVKFSVADEQPEAAPQAQEEFLSLSEILAEFKEGVYQQVGPEEYKQHYDLGISYKEMGLLEEAISEFQLATKGEQERLAAFEMLGLCFMDRNEPKFAIKQFERGIATPGHPDEAYIGLYYYLGIVSEQAGDIDKALEAYENAYNIDVTFRDAGEKVQQLREQLAPPPTQPARPAIPTLPPRPASQPTPQPAAQPQYRQPPQPPPAAQRPAQVPPLPSQQPLRPMAQPQPAAPRPAPMPAAAPQPSPRPSTMERPPIRPAAPPPQAPAVPASEAEQAPKPKPIPSKLKKPDKQRISYV